MFAQRFSLDDRKRRYSGSSSSSEEDRDADGSSGSLAQNQSDLSEKQASSSDSESDEDESEETSSDSEEEDVDGEDADRMVEEGSGGVGTEFGDERAQIGATKADDVSQDPSHRTQHNDDMDVDDNVDDEYVTKHQAVFKKFQASVNPAAEAPQKEIQPEEPVHSIAPLPQPELPRDQRLKATTAANLDWLATPVYTSPENTRPFADFGLSANMQKNLEAAGFTDAFSVQVSVIETMRADAQENRLKPDSNGDLLVNASTGSGKTLAYSVPIIETLSSRVVPKVRAIILVPTKPLVNQVKTTLLSLAKGTNLYVMNFRTDVSLKEEADKLAANEPDIIVSTPGRLVDHITNESVKLASLRYLVIDEADRLLNQSFQNWSKILIDKLESYNVDPVHHWHLRVQKLIFSATLTTDAGSLALLKFYRPRLVIVNEEHRLVNEMFSVPKSLSEYVVKYGSNKSGFKPLIVFKFLVSHGKKQNVLVFTKSNEASIRLAKVMQVLAQMYGEDMTVEYLNSTNNTSLVRNRLLKRFGEGDMGVLVVTDLIARGVDVATITDVVNYDMPNSAREYVHRVGRTARAGKSGSVYNFVFGKGEHRWFSKVVAGVSRYQEVEEVEGVRVETEREVLERALERVKN